MNNKFNEKHAAALEVIDPEIADFYEGWLHLRESDDFEAVTNLWAHLAREILEGLRGMTLKEKRVPKHIERTWKDIVDRLERFRHRHKVWDPPYKKEEFNEVWSEFEILLVYIVESNLDFRNIVDHCPFTTLQDSLMRLKTKLDKTSTSEWSISNIELSDPQSEINENLQTLAPLLAAFYRDWLRIRQSTNFKCRSYLLGHLAREIASGFKGVLSLKKDENEIRKSLKNEDLGDLREHKPHIASIMSALGVPDFNLRTEQWINISKDFANLAHKDRNEHEKSIRRESESLWPKFEELLAFLVGGYLNLLDRVDKILNTEQPDEDMLGTLHDLLEPEVLYKHFFQNLKSSAWLEPLKKDGWFNPENNPTRREDPDQPGYFYFPRWYALRYVEGIATQYEKNLCNETVNLLVDIVDTIINYTDKNGERICNDYTDLLLIKIIGALPIERIKCEYVTFMGTALRSKTKYGLVDQEIAERILPKCLDESKKELTLMLLKVILQAKVIAREITTKTENRWPKVTKRDIVSTMEEYWLRRVVKNHSEAIAKLCGIKAAEIALTQIRKLIAQDPHSFDRILIVAREPSNASYKDYPELLVSFTSIAFQFTPPDNVRKIIKALIQEAFLSSVGVQLSRGLRAIFGLIILRALTHYYKVLKPLFWELPVNPFGEFDLRPELRRLIEIHCQDFNEDELDRILHWIKSYQYIYREDEERIKIEAILKREWLSMLLKIGNEKIAAAYEKYDCLCTENTENSGIMPKSGAVAPVRPLTIRELSRMSNAQIADYLNNYQEPEIIGMSVLAGRGLADTLAEYVEAEPQRFTDNLLPFQSVQNLYQSSLLRGFLNAWSDKKTFDWAALLGFIRHIFVSDHFWAEQYENGFNYRNWVLSTAADLILEGTKDDTHAFDAQLLPLAEEILLILVDRAQQSVAVLNNLPTDVLNSDRGRVFSAMVNYALRFARLDNVERRIRWPQTIRADFTKRLDRSVESSFEFSYTLGVYLSNLLYLDEKWVIRNLSHIFPQQVESHWQAAFSGYLLNSRIYEDLYSLFKAHGHYQKAMDTNFADDEVIEALVAHICIGWIEDWEMLDDDTSLIYQLMSTSTSESFSAVVHFFLEQGDKLRESDEPEKVKAYEQVKAKIKPAWGVLFEELSKNSELVEYQEVLGPLSGWLGLIDTIDVEVLSWMKESIRHINKPSGCYITISRVVKALLKHVSKTPDAVAEIYLQIPQRVLTDLQTEDDEISETVRILYNNEYKDIADTICNRFGKAGVNFLRSVYAEYQT